MRKRVLGVSFGVIVLLLAAAARRTVRGRYDSSSSVLRLAISNGDRLDSGWGEGPRGAITTFPRPVSGARGYSTGQRRKEDNERERERGDVILEALWVQSIVSSCYCRYCCIIVRRGESYVPPVEVLW